MAVRIQRKRVKGWRAEGAAYVGRPSGWGNPFVIGQPYRFSNAYGELLVGVVGSQAYAVELFRQFLAAHPELVRKIRAELAGRDLMCWCPPELPCHADVLLEIANPTEETRNA